MQFILENRPPRIFLLIRLTEALEIDFDIQLGKFMDAQMQIGD
uniref:Uncharacterized protein n=1 Tax=Rhizophora mucronata TaxID=61149 RepID=A0A2P2Q1Z0_RHIMU